MLYFIKEDNTNTVKIGISKHPTTRLATLQGSNPGKLYIDLAVDCDLSDKFCEDMLHSYFSKNRLHGEWFSTTKEINDLIANIKRLEKTAILQRSPWYNIDPEQSCETDIVLEMSQAILHKKVSHNKVQQARTFHYIKTIGTQDVKQQGAGQVRLNANIPEKLHERLAIAAVKNKRSQGSIIIELLEEHIGVFT